MRLVPRLSRHLPDQGLPRALSARCAPLHFLSHHRAQGTYRIANSAQAIGNRIYGCDDCLAVCPWNKFAKGRARGEARGARRSGGAQARRARASRRCGRSAAFFSGSPVKRTGRDRFIRNVLIAIGNSGEPSLARGSRAPAWRCIAPGARHGGLGACRVCRRRATSRHCATSVLRTKQMTRSAPNGRTLECRISSASALDFRRKRWRAAWQPQAGPSAAPTATRRSKRAAVWRFDGTKPLAPDRPSTGVTHLLLSVPPGEDGDPVLNCHRDDLVRLADPFDWVGYLSTTGVYGDRGGDWVDENVAACTRRPTRGRAPGRRRSSMAGLEPACRISSAWPASMARAATSSFRCCDGTAKRIVKPGQVFSRIHVDDIAGVLAASIARPRPGRAYNVCDDEPARRRTSSPSRPSSCGMPPPPEIPFDEADLSPMAKASMPNRSASRTGASRRSSAIGLLYPTYREGLRLWHRWPRRLDCR